MMNNGNRNVLDSIRRKQVKLMRRELAKTNAMFGPVPVDVPKENWPKPEETGNKVQPFRVMRSRFHLVILFHDPCGFVRMTVCRTEIDDMGRWLQDITWDNLQSIKRVAGYGDAWAVECFPADNDTVNVAAMRHLWILPEPPPYGWRKKP
jgi:hypothetical protein